MTKQYKEEDIIIYYEGDRTIQLVHNGIADTDTGEVYHGALGWHVAVRSGEGVVKFIPTRSWNVTHIENPSFQIMECTETLIKPLEFFTKKTLQEICSLTERIKLDPKDTTKQIIDKIRKTAVSLFNEIERKSNPDIWNIGEVVICDKRLPCVITSKTEKCLEIAYWMSLEVTPKEKRTDYPCINMWEYSKFDKLEDIDTETLYKIFKEYVSAISTDDDNPVCLSREFLEIQISSYGKNIYDQHYKHMIITRVEKEKEKTNTNKCLFDKLYDSYKEECETKETKETKTIEVDMRDVSDIMESMNDAITFIKANSGASLDDQKVWKNLQRSVARIEATIKYGPH